MNVRGSRGERRVLEDRMETAMDTKRVRGRLVAIEVGQPTESGCTAIGVVTAGLPHEIGLRFEVEGTDPAEARRHLELDIEAYFC